MIRVTCPNCASKLSAKDGLAGQIRNCPKCAKPVRIVADAQAELEGVAVDDAPPGQHVQVAAEECLPSHRVLTHRLSSHDLPERLSRDSHYLICNNQRLVATWENDGRGWMFRTSAGFVSVKRARDNLPTQGDFKLIDLRFALKPEGKRLTGILTYQLATRWALTTLDEGDDLILTKIVSMGFLNKEQKKAVFRALKDQFMSDVWNGATEVLEYLDNTDYHSPGVIVGESMAVEPTHVSMVDFVGAVVFVDTRPPRGFDFAFHVFQTLNPQAAENVINQQRAEAPVIEVQYLGALGLSEAGFVEHARELAREEDPSKGFQSCVVFVQENQIDIPSGGKYHTVLCSYFRSKGAKQVVLQPGESLDHLLD